MPKTKKDPACTVTLYRKIQNQERIIEKYASEIKELKEKVLTSN
jgi:hypothetical protein